MFMKKVILLFIIIPALIYSQELPKEAIQVKPDPFHMKFLLDSNFFHKKGRVIRVSPDNLVWQDLENVPTGAKVAYIEGYFRNEGIFTVRVKFPPYYKLPAYWQLTDESVTVLEGTVFVKRGEVMDTTNAEKFTIGCYYTTLKEYHCFVFTQSDGCTLQISGLGPWELNFIEKIK